ncbi:hypothetical protein HJC23_004519 [Cyclotella cryptica]|uniref:Cytochrome P450 n=1 Tax=Cyclotella cryptica TaxID=29204 RepID=A0ABD3P2U7_9STRA
MPLLHPLTTNFLPTLSLTLSLTLSWLLGHFPHLHTLEPSSHHTLFSTHSSPSGITGLWGDIDRRAFHVLRADHARAVLRQNSSREPMKFLARHGFKTLGAESLILVPGGARWRRQRGVVARMFTVDAMREGRGAVLRCAAEAVGWLVRACEEGRGSREGCLGHGEGRVCMEALNLFELYSLLVFGRVSMGYDFGFFKKEDQEAVAVERGHGECCGQMQTCRCLSLSAVANSFAFLQNDVATRSKPQNLFNPKTQFYSFPTEYNQEYKFHSNVVRQLMAEIIGQELDKSLTNYDIKDAEGKDDSANLVTHLVKATLEEQFQPSSQAPSSKSTDAPKCPFATSTPSRTCTVHSSIPATMTRSQREETIDNVSSILRTLLMAGFETTAVSLSYVVYFLSLHPRCQDQCYEEAIRVLGPRTTDTPTYQDFDPEDLVYCRAVFTETIRIHLPVIFTTRVLEKDMTFDTGVGDDRVTFPRGTKAIISPTAIHADERNFERAKEFVPERWVKRQVDDQGVERWVERNYEEEKKENVSSVPSDPMTPESISAANPQNFFSFSDGARNCVGKRLAILESSVMIAMMFRDLRVELAEDKFELVTKRKFATVGPVRLPVVFRRRED